MNKTNMCAKDIDFIQASLEDNQEILNLLNNLEYAVSKTPNMTVKELWVKCQKTVDIPQDFQINYYTNLLRYLYCGIIGVKEAWYDNLPETPLSHLGDDWVLSNQNIEYSASADPELRDCIRKIRNATAHINIRIIAPDGYNSTSLFKQNGYVVFHDGNKGGNKQSECFKATLTIEEAEKFVNKLREFAVEQYQLENNLYVSKNTKDSGNE